MFTFLSFFFTGMLVFIFERCGSKPNRSGTRVSLPPLTRQYPIMSPLGRHAFRNGRVDKVNHTQPLIPVRKKES